MLDVRIRNLTKRFGSTLAVDQVSLDIPAGSLFFLLGPSGCGKTTLLRLLAGFLEPDQGTIHLGPRDITHLPPAARNTAMCFQSYALWPHMTVRQNILFGLEIRRLPLPQRLQRLQEVLELTRLTDLADRKPFELSGGQQQRVALARALVVQPDLLLLDEPLSNLDAKLRTQMRREIRRICKTAQLTTVYVTHDQKEALSTADLIAVLNQGRVIQVGPPQELYRRPNCRFVADFLGETNFLPATVAARQDPLLILNSSLGPLGAAVFPPDLNPGQTVTCSIRPEAIRLLPQPPSPPPPFNCWPARLLDRTFLGELTHYELLVGPQTLLHACELHPHHFDLTPASTPYIHIDPHDVVVLTA